MKLDRKLHSVGSQADRSLRIASYAIFLALSYLFIFRAIPLTADDQFYILYFSTYREYDLHPVYFFVEEPLFTLIINNLPTFFDPASCVRVLIAMTLLPHLYVLRKLRSGGRALVYTIGYFGFVELAVHLSWVQLRQGFALALFAAMLIAARERIMLAFAAIAGTIHTGFLVLMPLTGLQYIHRNIAYALIGATSLAVLAVPGLADGLTQYLGRRESVYLYERGTYSLAYILFSLAIAAYVSFSIRHDRRSIIVVYQAAVALFLPLFFMDTFGGFAERLYFVVKWLELYLVVTSRARNWSLMATGYVAMNLVYTVYHSSVNYNSGGYLDRIISLIYDNHAAFAM